MRRIFYSIALTAMFVGTCLSSARAGIWEWTKCGKCQSDENRVLTRLNEFPALIVLCPGTQISLVDRMRQKNCTKVSCQKIPCTKNLFCKPHYDRYCTEVLCCDGACVCGGCCAVEDAEPETTINSDIQPPPAPATGTDTDTEATDQDASDAAGLATSNDTSASSVSHD